MEQVTCFLIGPARRSARAAGPDFYLLHNPSKSSGWPDRTSYFSHWAAKIVCSSMFCDIP